MYSRFALIGATLGVSVAAAASSAVEAIHYQMNASTGRAELSGDGDATSFDLGGSLTLPVGQYFGASLSGVYSKSNMDVLAGSCDVYSSALGAGFFARAPVMGRIGLNYSHGNSESCTFSALGTSSSSADTNSYTVYAEYYLESLTLKLARARTDFDGIEAFNSASAYGTWYPAANVRLGVSAAGMDAEDTYALSTEYQPVFFGNSVSLSISYTKQRDTDSVTLGVTYFFDKRIDLKTRDRQYR